MTPLTCSACECRTFVGGSDARFCSDCGHGRELHAKVREPTSVPGRSRGLLLAISAVAVLVLIVIGAGTAVLMRSSSGSTSASATASESGRSIGGGEISERDRQTWAVGGDELWGELAQAATAEERMGIIQNYRTAYALITTEPSFASAFSRLEDGLANPPIAYDPEDQHAGELLNAQVLGGRVAEAAVHIWALVQADPVLRANDLGPLARSLVGSCEALIRYVQYTHNTILPREIVAAYLSGCAAPLRGSQLVTTARSAPTSNGGSGSEVTTQPAGNDVESNDAAREVARNLLAQSPPIRDLGTPEHLKLLDDCYAAAGQAKLDSGRPINHVSWERGCRAAAEDAIREAAEEGVTGHVYLPDNWAHDPTSRSEQPPSISVGTSHWFSDLIWTGWGTDRAVGKGMEHTTGCGSCPEQPGSPAPVTFILSQPGLCEGRTNYLKVRIEHNNGRVETLTVKPLAGTACTVAP